MFCNQAKYLFRCNDHRVLRLLTVDGNIISLADIWSCICMNYDLMVALSVKSEDQQSHANFS